MDDESFRFGPRKMADGIQLSTWAPFCSSVLVSYADGATEEMERGDFGIWRAPSLHGAGVRYGFMLDGRGPFPDPASRSQPDGVSGLSMTVDPDVYEWKSRGWNGLALGDYVIEEVHVGTLTKHGTFSGAESVLDRIQATGVTAVELMPVGQFYGSRNWGYDGVYIYAPQHSYGTTGELKSLVDALHMRGMAAVLDVVYNHLGPVGNHLREFGPYFSEKYRTPWGAALNFDGQHSDPVREFVLRNSIYWLEEFRFDALRLDAIHGIYDSSPVHMLEEMATRKEALELSTGRKIQLIAESEYNDPVHVTERSGGGFGLDAQWNDDFHNALHANLTGERESYYSDFGPEKDILTSLAEGFVYSGRYSAHLSKIRGVPWGGLPMERLVSCIQNHDQIGNRAFGDRLVSLVDGRRSRYATSLLLLSPFTPMLFMGEEYGENAPFLFFIDTDDRGLARKVYEGRLKEFEKFGWESTPDPNDTETFERCRLSWRTDENAQKALALHKDLLKIRREYIRGGTKGYRCSLDSNGSILLEYDRGLRVHADLSRQRKSLELNGGKLIFHSDSRRYGGDYEVVDGSSIELPPYSVVATLP